MNILIVEDHAEMRELLKSLVSPLAGAVHECGDGAEALSAYALSQPDWVLMDIEMKGMDGIAATRRIKAAFPQARIVIVTNHDEAELRESARAAGAVEYVLKENLLDLRRLLQTAG
jgi:two-component system NarL family response regulator